MGEDDKKADRDALAWRVGSVLRDIEAFSNSIKNSLDPMGAMNLGEPTQVHNAHINMASRLGNLVEAVTLYNQTFIAGAK